MINMPRAPYFAKRVLLFFFLLLVVLLFSTQTAYAADSSSPNFLDGLLKFLFTIAPLVAIVFIAKGGFEYASSSGDPSARYRAKQTIIKATAGLVLIIAAPVVVAIFKSIFTPYTGAPVTTMFEVGKVEPPKPTSGIVSVVLEAVLGFLRAIVESAAKPLVDGFLEFLTKTPTLLDNPTVVKFWLVIFGLTGSLFVLVMILLGFSMMTGDVFGLVGELSLKEILVRFGSGMFGAAMSLFLADTTVRLANFMVESASDVTGGVSHAWVMNVIQVAPRLDTGIANLILMVAYLFFVLWLLVMYVMRLVMVVTGAVFSPFLFLMLTIPRLQGFADGLIRNYMITVFFPFIHILMIQLFAAFLSMPEQGSSLLSLLTASGLFLAMLKLPGFLSNMAARGAEAEVSRRMVTKISGGIASLNRTLASGGKGG